MNLSRLKRFWLCNVPATLSCVLAMGVTPCGARQDIAVSSFIGAVVVKVKDFHGQPILDGKVSLKRINNETETAGTTNAEGFCNFDRLPEGTYRVTVNVVGMQTATSSDVAVRSGEQKTVELVVLAEATTSTTIDVQAQPGEIAEAQVEQQQKQRVFGLLPNHYVTYIWDAAPMTAKLKYKLALRSTIDPATFLIVAGIAGVEQSHKTFPGYEQGMEGYLKRYSSAYADTAVSAMIGRAVLPSLFRQDPRYFYRGSGSVNSRFWYAVKSSFICRGDSGRSEPNYSNILGSFAAAGISNLYRSPSDRSATLTLRNGVIVIGGGVALNVMREFLSRKLTPNVPDYAKGKP